MSDQQEALHSLTRQEFCFKKHISPSTFHKLKRQGLGPQQDYLGRISPEAVDAWDQLMLSLANSKAGKLEAERRREQATIAGRVAAESPLHVSKRRHSTARRRTRG